MFDRAVDLFQEDDNRQGGAHCRIMWGYEYYAVLGEWESARFYLNQGRELVEAQDETYLVNSIRFFIGLAYVELSNGAADFALHCIQQAEKLCLERGMSWWLPAVYYHQALIQLKNRRPQDAEKSLLASQESIEKGGNPDYLPLVLLQLSHLENDSTQANHYKQACVEATQARSRYFDQLLCLNQTADFTLQTQSVALREMAKEVR